MATLEPHTSAPHPAPSSPAVRRRVGPRAVVSALWLFAILNYLYCDVLSLHDAPFLRALLTGTVGGIAFTQPMILAFSVLMSIPIAAVLVSRISPHPWARWSSVVAGTVLTLVQIATLLMGPPTLHYLYFSVIEIITTAVIVWYAGVRWRTDH